jgi:regulation of enolase protein 1 (concanavalin A-like superfamily)
MNFKLFAHLSVVLMVAIALTSCGAKAPSVTPITVGYTPAAICLVPNVTGLDQAAAEGMLTDLGLQPVKTVQDDPTVAKGAVISQEPAEGTRLEPCTGDVIIVVSRGPLPTPTDMPTPTNTPVPPTLTPTDTPIPPTETPNSGVVPFSAPGNPQTLNPVFGWQPGGSGANAFDLTMYPGALTLIAGADTEQYKNNDAAPLVTYPIQGNFVAQVKVIFNPVLHSQHAGLGIRSTRTHTTWLRISRCMAIDIGGQGIWDISVLQGRGSFLSSAPYSADTVWLKVERSGSLFTLSYSANGSNWISLEKNYVFEIDADTEIFFFTYSTRNDKGVVAQFYDFIVFPK